MAQPSGRLLPRNTARLSASASPPRTREAGQARTWILADERRDEGRREADEWKRRAARMWPGVAADGIAATCWHGAGARPELNIGNISTRQDNYTLELLASEAPSRVELIP